MQKKTKTNVAFSIAIFLYSLISFGIANASDLSKAKIVEYVTFELLDSSSETLFAKAANEVNHNLKENYPGFIDRTISQQDNGTWIEVVFWVDKESAKKALDKFVLDPKNKLFLSLVKADSLTLTYSTVR
ncbi:hypothetical protein [Pelagibaculum spongiae]|uniref:ABM domain-containing protein n=1 Tax=Pelagibaculum spongiae TaxID=2080658 RepID=A0A2V1GXV0_9GAMM|nr:hypothetical protein [Pelagibaculum spongiae]PVZ70167.1 hypothetical protein DC094_06075 [Pelagibaculum spongiae]